MQEGRALIFENPEDFIQVIEQLQEAYNKQHEEGVDYNI